MKAGLLFLAIFLATALHVFAAAGTLPPFWSLDTLAIADQVRNIAMARDSLGAIHVAYSTGSPWRIRYGRYDDGDWIADTLAERGGYPISIAVTPAGDPSLSFTRGDTLCVARNAAGSWIVEKPDPEGWDPMGEGFKPIAIDDTGGVHVLYMKAWSEYWYAWRDSGAWNRELLLPNPCAGADLVIGPTGTAKVVAASRLYTSSGVMKIFTRNVSGWTEELVDTTAAPWAAHFDHDQSGHPAILTNGWSDLGEEWCFNAEYRRFDGSYWSYESLDGACLDDLYEGGTVSAAGFGFDAVETPHVLIQHVYYAGFDSIPVAHLNYHSTHSGTWFSETVWQGEYGTDSRLILDNEGIPIVAYPLPSPTTGFVLARRDFTPTSLPPVASGNSNIRLTPNPTRSGEIHLEIPFVPPGSPMDAAVYDLRGRLVRTLLRDERNSTGLSITWDGRSNRGRELPAGVYFVRVRTGSQCESAKLVLVR